MLTSDELERRIKKWEIFKQNIREGTLCKTAQIWVEYMLSFEHVMLLLKAIKENSLELFIAALERTCPLLFSADHFHYARYLTYYVEQLKQLDSNKPSLPEVMANKGFTATRSNIPNNRVPLHQVIEQTINKSAKCKGGIVGFSRNADAYRRWCTTKHKRVLYTESLFAFADLNTNSTTTHRQSKPSYIDRSESEIGCVMNAFDLYINPFLIDDVPDNRLILSCFRKRCT